jgi:FkbM family methyltransferase
MLKPAWKGAGRQIVLRSYAATLSRLSAPARLETVPGWQLGGEAQRKGIGRRVRARLWRHFRAPLKVRWLMGLNLCVLPGNETSESIYVTGAYEPNEFHMLNTLLTPGMVFVDAGANMGLYAIYAARKVGDAGYVVAIEPSARECEQLEANVNLNALSNVRIVRAAVSDCTGSADLLVAQNENSGHNTLGTFGYESVRSVGTETVAVTSIDSLVSDMHLTTVDVIKMDIEGAELRALTGALNTLSEHRPIVLLEISDLTLRKQAATGAEVRALLVGLGYALYNFDKESGLPIPESEAPAQNVENVVAVHPLSRVEWPW